jgi:hypothetical protein
MTLKIPIVIFSIFLLSGCASLDEIQNSELAHTVGSFQLNPVRPNNYWYDGKTYEYNKYQIEIYSEPGHAHISLDGKYIGDTPLLYKFTGTLTKGDEIVFRIMPFDENIKPFEQALKIKDELPRKINFKLTDK